MSLVYEALQKAAREKNRFAVPPAPPLQPLQPLPAPAAIPLPPKQSLIPWIGLSLGAVAVVVVSVAVITRKPSAVSAPPTLPANVPAVPESVSTAPVAVAPVPALPSAPVVVPDNNPGANDARFKLTGIVKFGEEYSAVINGHVVARDQSVNGAIVKVVTPDRVTLSVDGREIVVRLF